MKKKLLVILGPTSTSKTDLALKLAKEFNGEIVACDSRQVYVGLDIGTGKLPSERWEMGDGRWKKGKGFWEMDGVKIWMYDVSDFKRQYTVYDYAKDANKVTLDILKRGELPIIVGGTGFYLKALLEGLPNLGIPLDVKLRKELEKLSKDILQRKLQQVSFKKWEKMNFSDRQNPRRLIRAIEIAVSKPHASSSEARFRNLDVLKIGLTAPRQILYQRIDKWIISRIKQGMVDEARSLQKRGLNYRKMKQLGLEYGILADYLEGKIKNEQELIKVLQGKIHGYARRQITWFKNEKDVFWFDIMNKNFQRELEKQVAKWYYHADAAKD